MRPEFWSDSKMASLPATTRLTYIGLWCLADDAGYLVWQPDEIAAELYRFQAPATRKRAVGGHLAQLVEAGRVELLSCGRHAVIPTLEVHRIKGGQTLHTIRKRHEKECTTPYLRSKTETSVSVSVSGQGLVSGQGYESGRRRRELSPLDEKMIAAGMKPELVTGR